MTQHVKYNGSEAFALHKVSGPYTGHCSAYYGADGTLKDAEQVLRGWTVYTRPVKVGGPMWRYLQAVGRRYAGVDAEIRYNMDAIGAAGIAVGRNKD